MQPAQLMFLFIYFIFSGSSMAEEVEKEKTEEAERNIEKKYQCDVCREGFATKGKLFQHAASSHEPIPEPCLSCKDVSPHSLASHIKECANKKYECTICQKTYKDSGILFYHLRRHNDLAPYKCKKCDKSFVEAYSLTKHLKTHERQRRTYSCTFCPKTFASRKGFQNHQIVHEDDDSCEKSFSEASGGEDESLAAESNTETKSNRKKQNIVKSNLGNSRSNIANSKLCVRLKQANAPRRRKGRQTAVERKPFLTCDRCNRRFRHDFLLERHLQLHEKRDKKAKALPQNLTPMFCPMFQGRIHPR